MNITFIELPAFSKYRSEYMDDEALRRLQNIILRTPEAGDLIQGTGGLRKLRFAASGRGKRGGARVIYYWQDNRGFCWLLIAYAKNQQIDLTPEQRKHLAALLDQLKRTP